MIYVSDLPYMKTLPKQPALPKGEPLGKGNLIFLFSKSIDDSIDMINEKKTFFSNGKYRWYFYNLNYIGKIGVRRYRFKDIKERANIYKRIAEETTLTPYPLKPIISSNEERNTYYDLCRYYEIFNMQTEKLKVFNVIQLFWEYFKPIFRENYGRLKNKYVLIDANKFKNFKGEKLREQINNPIFLIYYTLWKRMELISDLDIDFLIYCNGRVLKINPSKCDEKSYMIFLREIKKLYSVATIPIETVSEVEIEDETSDEESKIPESSMKKISTPIKQEHIPEVIKKVNAASTTISKSLMKLSEILSKNIEEKFTKSIEEAKKSVASNIEKRLKEIPLSEEEKEKVINQEVNKKVEETLNQDDELIKEIFTSMQKTQVPKSSERSTARDKMLRDAQKDINIKGTTIQKLEEKKDEDIPVTDVSTNVKSTNPNVKKIKFNNFNKVYQDKLMTKDITDCFMQLNNKSIKMFVRDIQVEDSSDELNYKETWTVKLEDENRIRHTIKVDIPKFIENQFLWLGGNRKNIKNQIFFLPLVKIHSNIVLIVSNYNKLTITRVDTKSLRSISVLEKYIEMSDSFKKAFTIGNTFFDNQGELTTLELDELSKKFKKFHKGKVTIYFSIAEAKKIASTRNIKIKENEIFVGFDGTNPIILDMDSQRDTSGRGLIDIIFSSLTEEEREEIKKIKAPKRLMYTMITTMKQDVPLSVILCLWEGLSTILRKAKVKYRLSNNTRDIGLNEDYIKFNNCYLIYEDTIANELLLNGLKVLDTEKHDISEYESQEVYLPYIAKKYGRINAVNTLNNAYEFMLGEIEKSILKDLNLPTDIVSLCIHANNILCDSQYENEVSQNQSRIRSSEIIAAILYDKIAKAYTPFKNSNGKKKLSIPQDAVIKDLLKQKTVEDYSSLNPFLELETNHAVSAKGFRGVNLEQSFTVPKRCYDDTMIGIIGPSSSPDGNVGVNRTLTMEPNIKTARGYVDIKKDNLEEVKDVNLFSPAELLIPLGVTRDDAIRTGHSVKQSRHVIPVENSSPVLISNGSDEMCKYYLSSDFVINAKMDGKVVEKDEKTKLMIVEYKDGTHQAISLDKRIVKNGGGGFELSNILVTDLNVGDKFKKNDTLAWHKDFFTKNNYQGTRLNVGTLAKVAITSSYNTYEDGTFVTQKLSEKCTTEMCFKKGVVIGRHSNVSQMVKVGDTIEVGDPLIQFDESFEEGNINALLNSLGDNEVLKNSVISNNRNIIKSKYSGVIEEIKMYSTADLEELSPSLREIFKSYYNKINAKKRVLKKYNEKDGIMYCGLMLNEPTGKVEPNRYGNIRGEKVNDGVLIEFYLKHKEPLEVGSKIANFTALKNVVGEVLEEGYEPYSEFRPNEEISTYIASNSILSRMTPSILINGFGNKCIIELKRSLEEIWLENIPFQTKRNKMQNLIYRFFTAFDKSGSNTKQYKEMFEPMSDNQFSSFFREFFKDDKQYLILTVVDYERTIKIQDIERAAKVLNIPLYEHIYQPHINHDKEHPVVSTSPVPVIYINIKRTQQTVAKKNGLSTNVDTRSAITGQVVRHDKNGRESDLENIMLTSLGMENTLKELNGPRADDLVMKQQMNQSINEKGYVMLGDLDDKIENKTTLNTVDTYFLGMGLKTDLVTRGLKLINTLKDE